MRAQSADLELVLSDSFDRSLVVDILHKTDRLERDVQVETWSLQSNITRDPKTTGTVRIVHQSVNGESWVPTSIRSMLAPYRATLLITEIISTGRFERRVQLGLFDVTEVVSAEDTFADVNGREVVITSTVEVSVESLDGRVLAAALRSPRVALTSAWEEWQTVGILPVAVGEDDAELGAVTWPAEAGSRLDAVQTCARALGGVPLVDSFGQWVLADDNTPTVTLKLGVLGTVVELSSELDLSNFFNVVVGDYETEDGLPLRAEAVATGDLSPEVLGREIVRFHASDMVRTQQSAQAAVDGVLAQYRFIIVDVRVVCVYNPLLEIGDRVRVEGWVRDLEGVAQSVDASDAEKMTVVVRERRAL